MKTEITNDIYSSKEYKVSRKSYYIQCVSEYLVTILVGDAFLAKLLSSIGLSDALIGVVASLTSLAFLVQIGTIFLAKYVKNIKKTVILIDIPSMLCFLFVFLLPFINVSQTFKTILVFISIGGGFLLKYLQINIYYKWGNSFVKKENRGAFASKNEAISLAVGVVFSLFMGFLIDYFEKIGNLEISFIIIALIITILTIIDFWLLLRIKNISNEEVLKSQKSVRKVLKNTLGNHNFRNVIIMLSLFDIAYYFTIGFLGTFKIIDLALSVGAIQLISIAACGLRCILSTPMGRLADKTSYTFVYRIGLYLAALSFLILCFTNPSFWWFIILHEIIYAIAETGLSTNTNNMTYAYVKLDYFVQAQAIRSSICGVVGFIASIIGSQILSLIQNNGFIIFGFTIYAQQILAFISLIIVIIAILFNKFVVSKQKNISEKEEI